MNKFVNMYAKKVGNNETSMRLDLYTKDPQQPKANQIGCLVLSKDYFVDLNFFDNFQQGSVRVVNPRTSDGSSSDLYDDCTSILQFDNVVYSEN